MFSCLRRFWQGFRISAPTYKMESSGASDPPIQLKRSENFMDDALAVDDVRDTAMVRIVAGKRS
jgi:hypothetical protein